MPSPSRLNSFALCLIAALLLANLFVMLTRRENSAFAQHQAPIAGGAGIYVMPAQLSSNMWGCYLLDVDAGTLCAYQFLPGTKQLQLLASRQYTYDRRLKNFNTTPAPDEVKELVEKEMKLNKQPEPKPDVQAP